MVNFLRDIVIILVLSHLYGFVKSDRRCNYITIQRKDIYESHVVYAQVINMIDLDDSKFDVEAAYYDMDYDKAQPDTVITIGPFKNNPPCRNLLQLGRVYYFNVTAIDGERRFQSNVEPQLMKTIVKRKAGHHGRSLSKAINRT